MKLFPLINVIAISIVCVLMSCMNIVYGQASCTTKIDTGKVINNNPKLLLGMTFDARMGMHDNSSQPMGYFGATGTLVPGVNILFSNFPIAGVRYPGQPIMQGFNWKKSVGSNRPNVNLAVPFGPAQPIDFGFDEFMSMLLQKGTNPADIQIMVAIYDSTITYAKSAQNNARVPYPAQMAADWVEYCNAPANNTNWGGGIDWAAVRAANGRTQPYGVKIWNIGNEPWSGNEYGNTTVSANNFITDVTPIIDSMLARDPSILITLPAAGVHTSQWNTVMFSFATSHGGIYGLSSHFFPSEQITNTGVASVASKLSAMAAYAQSHNPPLKIVVGDYAHNVATPANNSQQDSAMQWIGANLCTDVLLLMSQTPNIDRANFWIYGLPVSQYHPIRKNAPGAYTLMAAGQLYEVLSPFFQDKSLHVTETSPPTGDGNPYSVRTSAFASNDMKTLNVVAVNRDRNSTHTLQVSGTTGYLLQNAYILTATGLIADTLLQGKAVINMAGDFVLPSMSVLIAQYSKPVGVFSYADCFEKVSRVYPNPTNDRLYFTNIKGVNIGLYNIFGQAVRFPSTGEHYINTADLPNGIYIFKVANYTEKIFIQH